MEEKRLCEKVKGKSGAPVTSQVTIVPGKTVHTTATNPNDTRPSPPTT